MDELSEAWYSGYHRRPITHSSCQLKTVIAFTVLILGGLSLVVIGVTGDSLHANENLRRIYNVFFRIDGCNLFILVALF